MLGIKERFSKKRAFRERDASEREKVIIHGAISETMALLNIRTHLITTAFVMPLRIL
jgi:hypothetical protein